MPSNSAAGRSTSMKTPGAYVNVTFGVARASCGAPGTVDWVCDRAVVQDAGNSVATPRIPKAGTIQRKLRRSDGSDALLTGIILRPPFVTARNFHSPAYTLLANLLRCAS